MTLISCTALSSCSCINSDILSSFDVDTVCERYFLLILMPPFLLYLCGTCPGEANDDEEDDDAPL